MGELDGLVAIVTGGASGIGAATADLLGQRGARVAVLDRDITDARRRAPRSRVRCDVTDTRRWSGRRRVVAGARRRSTSSSTTPASARRATSPPTTTTEWQRVLDVNVVGMARVTPRRRCRTCGAPRTPRS